MTHLDAGVWSQHFKKLNHAICEVVTDYSLVSFTTLDIQDKASVYTLLKIIDKSNGYVDVEGKENPYMDGSSISVDADFDSAMTSEMQEKYIDAGTGGSLEDWDFGEEE